MHKMLLLLLQIAVMNYVYASSLSVQGIIRDADTRDPIPFAHVVVNDVVVLTNLDGQFVINTHEISESFLLKVSVMGYEMENRPIDNPSKYHVIYLKPSIYQLDEVTVPSGELIMRDVFNRFHLNYEMSSHHMVGYYKENLLGSDSIYYIAEGIMDIYVPSNIAFAEALVSPIRTRKKVFRSVEKHVPFLKGNASDMAQSSIWRKGSFLSEKERKNYSYIYIGTSYVGEHEVLIVEFEPKNGKGDTHGKIYVDRESMAILRLEYNPITDKTYWSEVTWVEEYFSREGIYELLRVSYDGIWEEYNQFYNYHALLVINEATPTNYMPVDEDFLDEDHSFFHTAQEDFSDTFWEGYNYMKIDLESAQLLDRQGVVISSIY